MEKKWREDSQDPRIFANNHFVKNLANNPTAKGGPSPHVVVRIRKVE